MRADRWNCDFRPAHREVDQLARAATPASTLCSPHAARGAYLQQDKMRRPAALLATLAVASAQQNLKIRGVNLGGWLVLEQWIKPSLFSEWNAFDKTQPRDQWTYCAALGKKECKRRLEEHWDSWVTESTIADLADAGITHVRIPIGHWITCDIDEDEPYVCGEWTYLQRVAAWCQKYDILVWLDLHTRPRARRTGSTIRAGRAPRTGTSPWLMSIGRYEWSRKSRRGSSGTQPWPT